MKTMTYSLLMATAVLWLAGCSSTESRSQKLSLGMSRAEATKIMGSDFRPVASRVEPEGAAVSVIQYDLKKDKPLYLYFRQDKLVQWGDTSVLTAMPAAAKAKGSEELPRQQSPQ